MRFIYSLPLLLLIIACQSGSKKKVEESIFKENTPKLLKPQVKKIWVPPEIQDGGRIYIDGHWRYEVERSTGFGR